ncbi:YybH family protein [Brevibacillus porteri]|uniref:YybH family protein n=1 Tax=Brevibacillus porteri TaxID=2126350 RepID=UPI003D1CE40F
MPSSERSQPVINPEDMNSAFAKAFNSGDIMNLLALYEPQAILITQDNEQSQGIEPIRKTLEQLLQVQGKMVSTNVFCVPFENIALLRAHFIIHTTDDAGNAMKIEGHTSEIVRKQPDGSWLYVVDHPFGANPPVY